MFSKLRVTGASIQQIYERYIFKIYITLPYFLENVKYKVKFSEKNLQAVLSDDTATDAALMRTDAGKVQLKRGKTKKKL